VATRGQRTARPRTTDVGVTVLLFVCELLLWATGYGSLMADLSLDLPAAQLALFVVLYAPLLWRSRAPVAVLLAVLVVRAGVLPLGLVASLLPALAALYAVAAARAPRVSVALWAVVAASEYLIFELLVVEGPRLLPRLEFALLVVAVTAVPLVPGAWSRWRRLRQEEAERQREREHRERVRRILEDERAGMARELHDILAHSISVMVLQASGGREVLRTDPGRAAQALEQIEATGRQSMGEVRRLLGLLGGRTRESDLLEPSLARLDDLVRRVRDLGIPVSVRVEGDRRPVPASVDLTAYRILQEALTNVVKHSGATSATVLLRYRPDALDVEVADDGQGVPGGVPAAGKGLVGMRERARLVSGELRTGPGAQGGFRVAASLPLPEAVAA
jgi:signal transduction histidine kinase